MKKIAVICALPPERNTGMATVDLAALSVLRRIAPDAEITLYAYGSPNQYTYQEGELPFSHANLIDHQPAYLESDAFVFWGDFIHSRAYWMLDRGSWDERLSAMDPKARDAWLEKQYEQYSKLVFLSEMPVEKLATAIVFGSTIITNDAADELDDAYAANYRRLFGHAGGVYFRDAFSAAKVAPLRGREPTLASDCALLLDDGDLAHFSGFERRPTRQGVGVFFGRSRGMARMMLFSRLVARSVGEKAHWVPWFPNLRRARALARLFGYRLRPGHPAPGELLSEISGCRFVVTDTYHMCVNAWRLGIPAICIGQGASGNGSSLADKKKEVFFEMYGARRFYVFTEQLGRIRGIFEAARRAAKAATDLQLVDRVIANIGDHRRMAEGRLRDALTTILSGEPVKRPEESKRVTA